MSASFVVKHSGRVAVPGCFTVGPPDPASISVPQDIAEAASRFGVSDPEDFAAFSISFPDQVARVLNWTEAEVVHAGRLLAQMLGLPDESFSPPFGATLAEPFQGLTPAQFAEKKQRAR